MYTYMHVYMYINTHTHINTYTCRILLGDYWNVIGFPELKTKEKLHIHTQTYTKSSKAKLFIIRLSRKYYKVVTNLIQKITLKDCSSVT